MSESFRRFLDCVVSGLFSDKGLFSVNFGLFFQKFRVRVPDLQTFFEPQIISRHHKRFKFSCVAAYECNFPKPILSVGMVEGRHQLMTLVNYRSALHANRPLRRPGRESKTAHHNQSPDDFWRQPRDTKRNEAEKPEKCYKGGGSGASGL